MTDTDDLKRRARELADAATPGPLHVALDDEGSSIRDRHGRLVARLSYVRNPHDEHDANLFAESRTLLPALLARIEALEAERDASMIARHASPLSDADRVEALEADRAILRARLAKYERVVAAAREWSVRGAWSAAQELHDALDALDPKEAT